MVLCSASLHDLQQSSILTTTTPTITRHTDIHRAHHHIPVHVPWDNAPMHDQLTGVKLHTPGVGIELFWDNNSRGVYFHVDLHPRLLWQRYPRRDGVHTSEQ